MTQMQMGSNIALSGAPVRAALRWNGGPGVPDVDASALLLQATGQVAGDIDFVFYNQPRHPSGGVSLAGRVSGPTAADQIDIDPAHLPVGTERVVLAASATGGTFGQVPGLQLELSDVATGAVLAVFAMTAGSETAFVCAELYRRGDAWKFRAIGQGYASGLAGLAGDFGIQTGDAPVPAPTVAAPSASAPAPTLAPSTPAPAAASPPPSPRTPPVRTDGALDLDAPWPPR